MNEWKSVMNVPVGLIFYNYYYCILF